MSAVVELDHLMLAVRDSQAAGDAFERIGFAVTPRSHLPGMSNRLICFPSSSSISNNFVEFLAIDDAGRAPPIMREVLKDAGRPAAMVLSTADAAAAEIAFAAKGLGPLPVMAFKRDWRLPSGEILSPQFSVCIIPPQLSPLTWNAVQYLNPEVYRRPEFVRHRNGARRFLGVIAVADPVEPVAAYFENAWGARAERKTDGSLWISPGEVALRLYSPRFAAKAFPSVKLPGLASRHAAYVGFVIGVADLGKAREQMEGARPVSAQCPPGFWVSAWPGDGCLVVFEEE